MDNKKPKLCKCGCGREIVFLPHHTYRNIQFIRGHQARLPSFAATKKASRLKPDMSKINVGGLCMCGCGQPTRIATKTERRTDQYIGYPLRYIKGHHKYDRRVNNFRGGVKISDEGYVLLWMPKHHLANSHGYVPEHRLVWETTHNCRLTPDQHVHHINGNRSDNRPDNLQALTKFAHAQHHWDDPESRARRVEAIRKKAQDPNVRRNLSAASKNAWADPEKRALRIDKMRKKRIK